MPLETINHVTCTGCSLLCDDVSVDVQFNKVQRVHNACLRGNKKIHFSRSKQRITAPRIDDAPATLQEALDLAARTIKDAGKLLVIGGTGISMHAQERLVNLVKGKEATLSLPGVKGFRAFQDAAAKAGHDGFTLGEVINNSDLVVFWGANPVDLAPKLVVKTVFSRGRYRQSGKEVKRFVVIDDVPSPTMERADLKIHLDAGSQESLLDDLFSAIEGDGAGTAAAGVDEGLFKDLVEAFRLSEYGTIFLGEKVLDGSFIEKNPDFLEKLLEKTRKLNEKKRLAILPLAYETNFLGIYQQASNAIPSERIIDHEDLSSAIADHDVILSVMDDFIDHVPRNEASVLEGKTILSIDYKETFATSLSKIVLPVNVPGVESRGYHARLDGTIISLKPPLTPATAEQDDLSLVDGLLRRVFG